MIVIKKLLKEFSIPILALLLTCLYPSVFMFCHNVEEAPFASIFPFWGIFSAHAGMTFLILLLLLRKAGAAAFLSSLSMLVVINYTLIFDGLSGVIPELTMEHILVPALFIFTVLIFLFLWKKPEMQMGCTLISITFGALILVSFLNAGITSFMAAEASPDVDPLESYEPQVFEGEKPNVYFLLFDEYGGTENLAHYYDYHNALEDELAGKGFDISTNSYNTESLLTVTIIPNLMNMDYVATDSTRTATKNTMLSMPNFFRTFKDNGYKINLVNHLDYFGEEGCNVFTSQQSSRSISDYLLTNSLYSHIPELKDLINDLIQADYVAQYPSILFNAMDGGREAIKNVGPEPTLTMIYLQTPHAPTILDKNGKLVKNHEIMGWHWDIPELYLGQLEFVNTYILEIVNEILETDPNPLILVQSDHGCRQARHFYQMGIWETYDAPKENLMQQNFLNCAYYSGMDLQIEGKNGINTLRTVMNQVFGTNYKEIEPVYYTKGDFE